MQAKYVQNNLNYEFSILIEYQLMSNLEYCCEKFKKLVSQFPIWDNNTGRFSMITLEQNYEKELVPMDYCPFCGEKIEYKKM